MTDIHSVIEAFADNEPVDPQLLRDALATAEGRDHLVDVLVLRSLVRENTGVASSVARWPPAGGWWRLGRLSLAAGIAAVSLAGGYLAGRQSVPPAPRGETAAVSQSAPAPTRVIKLQETADWIDRAGGD
jgi:hypothetical protein